jgi:hypothetical protein
MSGVQRGLALTAWRGQGKGLSFYQPYSPATSAATASIAITTESASLDRGRKFR